ncbi:MAG: SMP-30/gluconolactonase/LRE family protein [Chloroflexi bacterium]|nr:SMP-30/gluconolactonase/LRE family protein [Chloroflexota bacterium]
MLRKSLVASLFALYALAHLSAAQQPVTVTNVASALRNPRGVAVLPDGRLIVAEAGAAAGYDFSDGRISVFDDLNGDGDYNDINERRTVMCCIGGYNALTEYGSGQDEVGGLGDIFVLDDGRIFFTQDDPQAGYLPDGAPRTIGVFSLSPEPEWRPRLVHYGGATINAIAYDPVRDVLYIAESGMNRVSALTVDGNLTPIVVFKNLAGGQQAVPAGLALDPTTGDLLVALLSGQNRDYFGTVIAYMPEAAKVVRLNPETGEWRDEITGLTTAVDVAVDDAGNIYVAEFATGWPTTQMPRDFPVHDRNAPPDAGGYPRFSGRVTMYPVDGRTPIRLAEGLDEPTNLTYHDGALYVSVGQGTPGRPIIGPDGLTRITGSLLRITGFAP